MSLNNDFLSACADDNLSQSYKLGWASTIILVHYGIQRGRAIMAKNNNITPENCISLAKLILMDLEKINYADQSTCFSLSGVGIAPFDDFSDFKNTGLSYSEINIYCAELKDGTLMLKINAYLADLHEHIPVARIIIAKNELDDVVNKYLSHGYSLFDEDGEPIKFEDLML